MSEYAFNLPQGVNLSEYETKSTDDLKAFYGLPNDIRFCSRCCYSNQKPNSEREYNHTSESKKPTVEFDENGVCAACRLAEQKKEIDWEMREKELQEICNKYRKNDGSYDCLVPGSGGKDSFYAAHKLKYKYGMTPLTVTWAPHIYTSWGWNNFQSWVHSGFDNYLFTPNGVIHRFLTRVALERLFHPFQPFILGQMYYPPKLAAMLGIPLVFYGENPAEYGNKLKGEESKRKEKDYFSLTNEIEPHISGCSKTELIEQFGLKEVDLKPYLPISADELSDKKIDVQYLGYYLPWHPQNCFYYAMEHGGFKPAPERTAGTYSKYSSIDDKIDDLHYYTTFIKFGIGRATYDASQEVRNGDITRDEAVALIKRYDGEYSERFEKENFEYLSINGSNHPHLSQLFEQPELDHDYFTKLTNKFRSPHLWKVENGNWRLREQVFD